MTADKPTLLVAGIGPLPPERPERLHAPGLRVWGMARELARAGHRVRLVRGVFGVPSPEGAVAFDLEPGGSPGEEPCLSEPRPLAAPPGGWSELLHQEAVHSGAAAAVGSTDRINHALACTDWTAPMWMDFFGDPMAERQLLAHAVGDDAGVDEQWAMLAAALARADRVSGCSHEQCAALRGQLSAVGRWGRWTLGTPLVHRIPPWIEPTQDRTDETASGGGTPLVRGAVAPADAILVIQTGGFNTWLDEATLAAALEQAMAIEPRLHFAATGGPLPGHYDQGFRRFEAAVLASRFAERFHLLGWRPAEDVARLLAEADLAINVDRPCLEGRHGTRNRLLDWVLAGLAVISTPGCELAEELGRAGYLKLVPHGDVAGMAQAILQTARGLDHARRAARIGAAYLRRTHTAAECLAPLLAWAGAPQSAPDLLAWREGRSLPPDLWRRAAQTDAELRRRRWQAQRQAWLERRLARLEGSRLVRWALRLRGTDDLRADPPPPEP